jgi:hypothetical protein
MRPGRRGSACWPPSCAARYLCSPLRARYEQWFRAHDVLTSLPLSRPRGSACVAHWRLLAQRAPRPPHHCLSSAHTPLTGSMQLQVYSVDSLYATCLDRGPRGCPTLHQISSTESEFVSWILLGPLRWYHRVPIHAVSYIVVVFARASCTGVLHGKPCYLPCWLCEGAPLCALIPLTDGGNNLRFDLV